MGKVSAKKRAKMPTSQFALGGKRYPVHDRAHAANAKARASAQYKRGRLSRSSRDKVFARANKVLKRTRKTRHRKR